MALERIPADIRAAGGVSMIRTKGEPGTGDVVQAVRHMRVMNAEIRKIQNLRKDELFEAAKHLEVPLYFLDMKKVGPATNFQELLRNSSWRTSTWLAHFPIA